MANPGSELVRQSHIFRGATPEEITSKLAEAIERGLVHGDQYTVTRLKNGQYAVKVWLTGRPVPGKPKRWPLTPGQTLALSCCLGALAFLAVVLWMIVQAVTAVSSAIVHNVRPIVGGLIVLGLVTLFIGRGGGGTFSGTFKGTWR